jgi:acetyl-CoA C-acetyltransferase
MDRVARIVGHIEARVPQSPSPVRPCPTASANLGDRDVCIVSAVRTPMGGFSGSLSPLSATKLGSIAIRAALERAGVQPAQVQEVVMGNVLSGGLGQAPARQASLGAGIPHSVPCTTVNKVCSSGMKAVMFAAQSIRTGEIDVAVAGGMESMSNVPYYLPKARVGMRMGDGKVVDGMMFDGLRDAYDKVAMGVCAEACAEEYHISRQEQDAHATESYVRSLAATRSHVFDDEIVPVQVKTRRKTTVIKEDDECSKGNAEKLKKLRAVFKKGGTVTAGNASVISDGAAALVLVSGKMAKALKLNVLGVLLAQADAAQTPAKFTTAPALAIPLALQRAGVAQSEVDLFEINEAFSVVALVNQKILALSSDKVNVYGGAVSMGHPLGTSGARILVTLLHALRRQKKHVGVAGICNGGGGASACVIRVP